MSVQVILLPPLPLPTFQDDEDDDDDDSDDEVDKTTLESFTTPLDKDDCEVDEYCVFKDVMQSQYYHFFYNYNGTSFSA